MPKVWLITGSGNGLGRDIAVAALAGRKNWHLWGCNKASE